MVRITFFIRWYFLNHFLIKNIMNNLQKLSDRQLYSICKKWGAAVLEARRKFAGLLPEVQRREIAAREKGGSWLKKRGFFGMYDFAARLAGMSQKQVDEVIRQDKRFKDKPMLRAALVNGEVSVNKLARVVSIATVENQREILGKVEALSKAALDVFMKDYKRENEKLDGLIEPKDGQIGLYGQNENANIGLTEGITKTELEHSGQAKPIMLPVNLDEDIAKELLEMQSKNIDVNGLLREFLRERKEKIEKEKQEAAEKQMQERDDRAIIGFPAKRYVPVEVRKIIHEEFGDKCSAAGCGKPAENLHHEKGFAKDQCHDPRYLKPMCKGHHELAHAENLKVQKYRMALAAV